MSGRYDTLESWYEPYIKANGKPGKSLVWQSAWYTPLFTCIGCDRLSTPRNVRPRDDIYIYEGWGTPTLCTGCWNQARAWIKRLELLIELRRLVRELRVARAA